MKNTPSNPNKNSIKARWFSENPDKAWAEKFFLIYSPIWMLQVFLGMALGISRKVGDVGALIQALLVALPLVIVPLVMRRESRTGKRWHQTYWFKANLYIFIFSFIGNYFGSEYFFDVLGMVYNYPQLHLNFDSALLGTGEQKVPVIMFFMTQAYFMTYHTSAVVVLRRLRTSRLGKYAWLFPIAIFVIGFFWAWMESFAMANPMMKDVFYYKDLDRMLAYGSITYSCYFIASFPIFYFLDEKADDNWGWIRTAAAGLSAGMLTLLLLDLWTRYIGPI
jgi:cycloeucalenol cycloisomerase